MKTSTLLIAAFFVAACTGAESVAPGRGGAASPPKGGAGSPPPDPSAGLGWVMLQGNEHPGDPPAPALRANSIRQSLALGVNHTCVLDRRAQIWCWGKQPIGPPNEAETASVTTPTLVPLPLAQTPMQIAAGAAHTCALVKSGSIYCWGDNSHGQLGVDPRAAASSAKPALVASDQVFSQLAAGGDTTCAVTPDGGAFCWGANSSGQLGDGTFDDSSAPRRVELPAAVGFIATSANHTCATESDSEGIDWGSVWCWGDDSAAQLGNIGSAMPAKENSYPKPLRVLHDVKVAPNTLDGLTVIQRLALGDRHSCAFTLYGNFYCWGAVDAQQIGEAVIVDVDGYDAMMMFASTDFGDPPGEGGQHTRNEGPVPYTSGWLRGAASQFAAGANHSCAITTAGAVLCWGSNSHLQLGPNGRDGEPAGTQRETHAMNTTGTFVEVAAGGDHTCAIASGGEIECWGDNRFGQLGIGPTPSEWDFPAVVAGGPWFADLDATDQAEPLPTDPPLISCLPDPSAGIGANGGALSSYLIYAGDLFARAPTLNEVDFAVWSDSSTLKNQFALLVYSQSGGSYQKIGESLSNNIFPWLGNGGLPTVRFVFPGGLSIPRGATLLQLEERDGQTLNAGSNSVENAGAAACPAPLNSGYQIPLTIYAK